MAVILIHSGLEHICHRTEAEDAGRRFHRAHHHTEEMHLAPRFSRTIIARLKRYKLLKMNEKLFLRELK
jgi:hypothetical protein